jgi:ABC-type transporter Mla subunit MlaD
MNYFEYFSEIEERFSRRRGSILLLNTLDWALIETWREAGIPLEAVLRGIDAAFDKYDARAHQARGRLRKVNGLAWCAQAVMQSAEELVEASTGLAPTTAHEPRESGFESERVASYLDQNAQSLEAASATTPGGPSSTGSLIAGQGGVLSTTAARLRELANSMRGPTPLPLDDLDRTLTVLEEKLLAALQSSATEQELVDLKTQADRELAPYRAKMSAVQLRQVQQQFLHKRLLELRALPRLSLFYMSHG